MPNTPYPTNVEVSEEGLAKLTDTMKQSYKDIVAEINGATDFGVANRKQILAQINVILAELKVNVDEFIATEIPDYYKTGAQDAVKQLEHLNAEIKVAYSFNNIHEDAIAALVSDTQKSFADAIVGVGRSANLLLNKAVKQQLTQKMATGTTQGAALREVRLNIKGVLQEQGLDSLVDKAGHSWSLDRYSEMLYRTKTVEARNTGLANRMVQNGYDLVQVSVHGNPCPLCEPYQGQILSVTGADKEYPSLAQAEADGLFHPNCEHAINAISLDLAKDTMSWDSEAGQYVPSPNIFQ